VQRVPALEGLDLTPSLYLELQRTFDVLTCHGYAAGGASDEHPLIDWRRNVSGHFLHLLEGHQYLHWAGVLEVVRKAISKGKIGLPEKIILAGFDELSPMEETFVQILGEKARVIFYRAQKSSDTEAKVRVYATPEQECQAICAEVLNTWNEGQRRLGIVFLDEDYFSLLKRCFEELTDREVKPRDALRYNLTMGIPLSEHPLFQTAMILFRLLEEPAPHVLLSSLFTSPYVREKEEWDHHIREVLWNSDAPGTLSGILDRLRKAGFPVEHAEKLTDDQKQPLKVWLALLKDFWQMLGFPLCGCETDILAKEHLFQIVEELEKEAGHLEVDRKGVLAWFSVASRGIEVVEKTPELTGIQVLNPVEARGLAFDRLWVVSIHGYALPEPVRDLPFLAADERRMVEGGTIEGQWEAGRRTVSYLLASAAAVAFSRAASRGEDQPYLECPLIPDESPREDPHHIVDLWKNPPGEWMRARWLREGIRGLLSGEQKTTEDEKVDTLLPKVLNVTSLETLLACPFQYFAGALLSLKPLEDPKAGIDPLERGEVIHRILRDFARRLIKASPERPIETGNALALLREVVTEVLAEKPDSLFWRVERLRLLGDGKFPGLLTVWLEEERKRAIEGWRIETAETSFEGLQIGDSGVALKGKVDRIDSHAHEGMMVWDYKTVAVPTSKVVFKDKVAPQLPAYLLALMRNLIRFVDASEKTVRAGYIPLKRASEIKISPLRKNTDWEEFLKEWESAVRERIEEPLKGVFLPDPRPSPVDSPYKNACENCGYINLCNYFGSGEGSEEEDDEA
jgi:RecB family exonuclease